MTPARKQRLNVIGFDWDPLASAWEATFSALERFKGREGHCRVPMMHVEDGVRLGRWVQTQRQARETMSPDRRHRLDAIGFEWDLIAAAWETAFAALERFRAREGHCRVPVKHVEDGFKLGQWVSSQRASKNSMLTERKTRLDAIGFYWGRNS